MSNDDDLALLVLDFFRSGVAREDMEALAMQVGMLVIRKVDVRNAVDCVGTVVEVGQWSKGERARVKWLNLGNRTWIATAQLVEATDEVMVPLREKAKARREQAARERDAARIYLCNNVNPTSRVSNDGHRKPMPLEPGQVVDGKCLYCGHPVVKRHEDEEWSDQESRFITPAIDLDTHNEQVLDTAYGPEETR